MHVNNERDELFMTCLVSKNQIVVTFSKNFNKSGSVSIASDTHSHLMFTLRAANATEAENRQYYLP